ncbi:MAG: hypothetical protein SFU98_01380 [Leptospiraceae bacterium]|nr:hypothetical protein [Leptospiraceae bacterium]
MTLLEKYSHSILVEAFSNIDTNTLLAAISDSDLKSLPKFLGLLSKEKEAELLQRLSEIQNFTLEDAINARQRLEDLADIIVTKGDTKDLLITWNGETITSHSSFQIERLNKLLEKSDFFPENFETLSEILIILSEISRRSGLLDIEVYIEKIHDEFIRTSLQIIVDGTEPKVVSQVCKNFVQKNTQNYNRQLEAVSQAILGIQEGLNPHILTLILKSAT